MAKLFLTVAVAGLHWTCPNHLKRVYLILSPIAATPKCSWRHSFLIFFLPSFTTHPRQHYLLWYIDFVHTLLLDWLTFRSIGHSWSNCFPVKFSLQYCWHSSVTKHFRSKYPLQPSCFKSNIVGDLHLCSSWIHSCKQVVRERGGIRFSKPSRTSS